MRRWAMWIVIGVAALLGLAWLLSPSLVWDGGAVREVLLTVMSDGLPVTGATVRHNTREVGMTDASGMCNWLGGFGAGGTTSLFRRKGNWVVGGELTIMTADGHSYIFDLARCVKDVRRPLSDRGPVEVTVRLDSGGKAQAER